MVADVCVVCDLGKLILEQEDGDFDDIHLSRDTNGFEILTC